MQGSPLGAQEGDDPGLHMRQRGDDHFLGQVSGNRSSEINQTVQNFDEIYHQLITEDQSGRKVFFAFSNASRTRDQLFDLQTIQQETANIQELGYDVITVAGASEDQMKALMDIKFESRAVAFFGHGDAGGNMRLANGSYVDPADILNIGQKNDFAYGGYCNSELKMGGIAMTPNAMRIGDIYTRIGFAGTINGYQVRNDFKFSIKSWGRELLK